MVVTGSCLCGAVLFELDVEGIVLCVGCYCEPCRKVSGGAYGVYLQVRQRNFRWLAGEREVATFESSPGNYRGFCRTCGCVAPVATAYGAMRAPAGALDGDPAHRPDVVLFEGSRAGWCGLDDAEQRFADAGPPEFWRKTIAELYG